MHTDKYQVQNNDITESTCDRRRGTHTTCTHITTRTNSSVDVLETRGDTLTDVLKLALVLGVVHSEGVENEDLAPLSAFVKRSQQLGHCVGCQVKQPCTWVVVVDLSK